MRSPNGGQHRQHEGPCPGRVSPVGTEGRKRPLRSTGGPPYEKVPKSAEAQVAAEEGGCAETQPVSHLSGHGSILARFQCEVEGCWGACLDGILHPI